MLSFQGMIVFVLQHPHKAGALIVLYRLEGDSSICLVISI